MNIEKAIFNLDKVITNIERARLSLNQHHIVQLVAISKYSTANEIKTLYEAGQRSFGENKIQDLKLKQEELKELPIAWHFVGNLQKNKINNLIECNPVLFHSLDSYELAQLLDKKLQAKNKTMNCLIQINSAYEETKSGLNPDEAVKTIDKIKQNCQNIKIKGVMCIGANTEDTNKIEKSFKTTKDIYDKFDDFTICSMGMSGDFELAIKNGSNMIRVGSALFK